jgi:hypothetical protein
MTDDLLRTLPPDLVSVLRDQSLTVARDAAVFALISQWSAAPTSTLSAPTAPARDTTVVTVRYTQPEFVPATTPAGCY